MFEILIIERVIIVYKTKIFYANNLSVMMVWVLLESNTAGGGKQVKVSVQTCLFLQMISKDIPIPSKRNGKKSNSVQLNHRGQEYRLTRMHEDQIGPVRLKASAKKNTKNKKKATHQVDVDFRVTKRTNS